MIRLILGLIFVLLVAQAVFALILAAVIFRGTKSGDRTGLQIAAICFGIGIEASGIVIVSLLRPAAIPIAQVPSLVYLLFSCIVTCVLPLGALVMEMLGILPRWSRLWARMRQ